MNAQNEIAAPAQTRQSGITVNGGALSPPCPTAQSPKSFKELDAETDIDPSFKPRWVQQECVDGIFDFFYKHKGEKRNPLAVIPTGGGKSHILGMFCKRVLDSWPDQQILILTHVDTIIKQDYLAIRKHLPSGKVGIFSAGVGKKERRSVTVAGIQSIHKRALFFKGTTIILIDEAHTVPPKGEGQYRTFLSNFDVPIVGLTATHFRLGSGFLHEGEGRTFTDIAYEADIERMIADGFLCNLIPRETPEHINTEGIHTQNGDFVKKELKERATREGLTEAIIADLQQYKEEYRKWLLFAIDIEHAELITKLLIEAGIRAAVVHSKQPKGIREQIQLLYQSGFYQALVSIETLTTGFDDPSIDLIGLLRPTKSPVLHIQMIGRGLRVHPGKKHCLVLDYAGNVHRLGPINDVHVQQRKKKGKGPGITKTCPSCKTIHAGAVKICHICGHEFQFKEKLKEEASTKKIIRKKKEVKVQDNWYDVQSVAYEEHYGVSGLCLMTIYHCGIRTFFDYKRFDAGTKAGYHANYWWVCNTLNNKLGNPQSTGEAIIRAKNGELWKPSKILVREGLRYPDILKMK